jgi:hypothetical protein
MQSKPSQNSPSRSTNVQSVKSVTALPNRTNNAAPVEARDANKTRMTFERALDRQGQSDAFSSERGGIPSRDRIDDRPERDTRGGNDQQKESEDDTKDQPLGSDILIAGRAQLPITMVAGLNPFVTTAAPLLSQEQIANLQRMAAAIAEIAKTGIDAKMTVQFGNLNGIADSAIFGRDARGGLTIHLIGAPPHMTPANAQMLRSDLMQRLLKRRLDVSSVDFVETEALTEQAVNQAGSKR